MRSLRMVARGHRVRVAGCIALALREVAADPRELLISDIGLPDGSGIDLVQQIKPSPTFGAIAMSGFGMEKDVVRSRDAGFATHLTKPVDFALLEKTIAELSSGEPPSFDSRNQRTNRVRASRRPRATATFEATVTRST